MPKMSKRVELRFPDDLWDRLTQIARSEGASVASLIREAVIAKYGEASRQEKLSAVERLAALSDPAPDWDRIEDEIVEGAVGHRAPG